MDDQAQLQVTRVPKRRGPFLILVVGLSILLLGGVFLPWQLTAIAAEPALEDNQFDTAQQQRENRLSNLKAIFQPAFQQAAQDLQITKTHQGDFQIGSSGAYTIQVGNVGTDPVSGSITVTDALDPAFTPVSVAGSGWAPCNFSAQLVTCIFSNTAGLPAGDTLPPILLSVDVNPADQAVITNTALVSHTQDVTTDNNITADPTRLLGVDLQVTKRVSPTHPAEGETIVYTVQITNAGPNSATGVALTDLLPASLTFQSWSATQGTYSSGTGLWSVGNIPNGGVVSLSLNALVNDNTRGQTIVNTAQGLQLDQNDYLASNNSASVSFVVATTQLAGRVTSAATDAALQGVNITLLDSQSRVYTTTTASNGWYTFTSTIANPLEPGPARLTASRSGYLTAVVTPTIVIDQFTRQDIELDTTDLVVTMSDGRTTVVPGTVMTYSLTVQNKGSITATNVIITDVLPTHLTYITDTLDITHSVPVALTYVWKLGQGLAPNHGITFDLRVRVAYALPSPTTALTNSAFVANSRPEAITTNNSVQDTNTSTGSPTVSITNSVSPSQVRTGQNATYTIRVQNTGTAPATDVVVTDQFSTFLDITSAKTTEGTATTNATTRRVTVTINVLNINETVTITVVGRVNTTARSNTTVTNSASLTYKFGGTTFSRTSNSVSFSLIVTSSLPGTGGIEIHSREPVAADNPRIGLLLPAVVSATLLGLLAVAALVYGLINRQESPEWSRWALKMSVMFGGVAFLFGVVAWGLYFLSANTGKPATTQLQAVQRLPVDLKSSPTQQAQSSQYIIQWPEQTEEPETLPDYPIPTPTLPAAKAGDKQDAPDTSPVERIIIPVIGVDTIVKYVPYDGITWMIGGLKQEVAWMGDTSWPGLGGNTGLAGHVSLRTGEDGPFRYISDLEVDDLVFLYTAENIYSYRVNGKRVVEETDLSVIKPSTTNQITLITCTDWDETTRLYRRRLVIQAELQSVKPLGATAKLDNWTR